MPGKTKGAATVDSDVAALADLDVNDLRQLWEELLGIEPLPRISRELLIRAIAWRLQENAERGLSRKMLRKLDKLAAELASSGEITLHTRPDLRAGTRLVREWRGEVHEVIALDDHYLWKGARYRSLSEIARAITGTRWSGPRFFGTGAAKKANPADQDRTRPAARLSGGSKPPRSGAAPAHRKWQSTELHNKNAMLAGGSHG